MSKIKPNTKEQLVDYLTKHISLGTYDKRFLNNLINLNFVTKNPVTTNQAALLNTIVARYRRQLAKNEIDSNDMVNLPWTLEPIPSLPTYTEAHLLIEDDTILLRSPYKTTFVKDIKTLDYGKWDRDTKTWSFPMNEVVLKRVIDITNKHYDTINYCTTIKEIIDILLPYEESKYWNPTLVKTNDRIYVAACNQALLDSIKHIPLTLEVRNLARLVYMGITIGESITESLPELERTGLEYSVLIDKNDIKGIVNYIQMIEADYVIISDRYRHDKSLLLQIANILKANKVNHRLASRIVDINEAIPYDLTQHELPVMLNLGTINTGTHRHVAKIICMVNNNPIEINENM
jgi:hypothetical protein